LSSHDDALRAMFSDLRNAELRRVPAFQYADRLQPVGRLKPSLTLQPIAAFAIVLFVITSFVSALRTIPTAEPVATVTATWEGPTDFLLNTPQMDVLTSVPKFGERTTTQ
jgi:hypothetical protein